MNCIFIGLIILLNLIIIKSSININRHSSFLPNSYKVKGHNNKDKKFDVRQVPGDGGCLFHAIAVVLRYEQSGLHTDFDSAMKNMSHCLRKLSVDTLMEDKVLIMEGNENTTTTGLLETVAEHYNMTAEKYCDNMRLHGTWGGGPEIVALSNFLKRPIHVYELCTTGYFSKCFELKVCAKFGTPSFDDENKLPISILCADGRFPNILPGAQKMIGDHFLALFNCEIDSSKNQKKKSLRGKTFQRLLSNGGSNSNSNGNSNEFTQR